ncbi:MAG: tryptophan synthase subunit beta [Deltaproteobacteria bacterium]|nr:tryptophan synthase subunit beta [Deltaproteobacteria bacterium]MBW1794500.1 tryptophan synthase subunit beta [Deltaproteobacteria bacterium]MBW2330481.1 tryptophan synthase subunit beta [Deltaproteobacteria bacterium]
MERPGYYGQFGGTFIPEILVATFDQLRAAFEGIKKDPSFWKEYQSLMSTYSCRPTPLTYSENLTRHFNGPHFYIKREDLNHTGAHKLNNVMGQGLVVQRMGKSRVIAETGAGQHGVATATMAAKFGFECTIYMGEVDMARQRPNVFWMEQLGATVVRVTDGDRILKDAINEALRDWATNMDTTHYVLGTVCGPHPYPEMVSYFQSIIGSEARDQIVRQAGRLPKRVYACVGGGSNALGIFSGFLDDTQVDSVRDPSDNHSGILRVKVSNGVELVGVEAGGEGLETRRHASRLASVHGSVGVAQGYKTYFLQDDDGQMLETHSVAAGLDYIGVSPILAAYYEQGIVRFEAATNDEVLAATRLTMKKEGIIPALESSHALACAFRETPQMSADDVILINLSGRGDKDIFTIADALGDEGWKEFITTKAEAYSA